MGLLIIQWKAKNYPSLLWLDLEMKKPENCQSKLCKMMIGFWGTRFWEKIGYP